MRSCTSRDLSPSLHDGEPEEIDAALGHARRQRGGVADLVALAGE